MAEEMVIERSCPMCRKEMAIKVSKEGLIKYSCYGKLIQESFPELNPMEREFIKTGYCPDCQKKLFGTEFKSNRFVSEEELVTY